MNDVNKNISLGKHILILTPGFPKDEADDNCIPPLQEYLIAFTSAIPGSKIKVISLHYPSKTDNYIWNGITVHPLSGKVSRLKKPFLWFKVIREAKKINAEHKIDIIHSFWLGECSLIGNYLSKKLKCTHICTLMGQDVKPPNKYLKLLKNNKTKFIALSKNQADEFNRWAKRKADKIIHWGINDQQILLTERDIDLLAVGSLIPLKNYSLFIQLAEEAVKIFPDLKCVIAGSGPELQKLKSFADEKNLLKNIKFKGLLNRTDIFKLMQRSKILIHPSNFESFGYVFAEALVNGMNIVSFNVGCALEHPKWFIAKDEKDFVNISINLLSGKLNFSPYNPFQLTETVKLYAEVYF
jgi:glycosyltransferase involved in cell wall biosynthesis